MKKVLNRSFKAMVLVGTVLASWSLYAQQFDNVNIKQMWSGAYNDGARAAVRVFTTGGTFSSGNGVGVQCTRTDAFIIRTGTLGVDQPANINFELQFSMLLAAQHADESISVWVSGCSQDGNYPVATRITTFE